MADTPIGETATPGVVSNDVPQTPAPVTDNGSAAEVERLRKEAEQAKMRANQLANELEAKTKAEEAAKQKQMEEQEEFRTLYQQLKSQVDERDAKDAERERQATLATATQEVFKDYPKEVVELAETAGLSLSDDSEDARKALAEKLDAFKARVTTSQPGITSNNQRPSAPTVEDRQSLVTRSAPGQESPMAMAAARGDNSVTYKYIGSLPAIQRMREIAQGS